MQLFHNELTRVHLSTGRPLISDQPLPCLPLLEIPSSFSTRPDNKGPRVGSGKSDAVRGRVCRLDVHWHMHMMLGVLALEIDGQTIAAEHYAPQQHSYVAHGSYTGTSKQSMHTSPQCGFPA
jgi:hypothetical protein